jgi:hypothetical protein
MRYMVIWYILCRFRVLKFTLKSLQTLGISKFPIEGFLPVTTAVKLTTCTNKLMIACRLWISQLVSSGSRGVSAAQSFKKT